MRLSQLLKKRSKGKINPDQYYDLRDKSLLGSASYDEEDGLDTTELDKYTEPQVREKLQARWKAQQYERENNDGRLVREMFMHLAGEKKVPEEKWPDELEDYKGVVDSFSEAYLMHKFDIKNHFNLK